ncbi:hypothetical protein OV450_1334 [Actinobacteria bacterium OV450]|nr:hypothetical protein OV450_1334 [Actinobacteria bacterium OV450]
MPSTHTRDDEGSALRPETPLSAASLTTLAERRLASGHWLLASATTLPVAMRTWRENGAAWLRPGALYCAVLIPAAVMHAATGYDTPEACAPRLADVLDGPVFYDPSSFRQEGGYTALLPLHAALMWRVPSTLLHPPGTPLLVPAPDRCTPVDGRPWWVVPLESPGQLCSPALVAALAGLGRRRIVPEGGELQ